MAVDRRGFCKVAGLTTLAVAGARGLPVVGQEIRAGSDSPAAEPLVGERWAMVVDLQACRRERGCTKCIDACHRTHNVPHLEKRHEVKWIWKESFEQAFPTQKHGYVRDDTRENPVLVFCNHCDDPPCTRVCPTRATWKREDGVVMMDWHRCIGCRYCIAGCPYGSRSFNWVDPRPAIDEVNDEFPRRTRGVVEKCNLCEERLAKGKLPACVEACEAGCLTFGDLADPRSEVRAILSARYAIRRKPALGTEPQIYYLV